jgi:hypothetical protein
MSYTEKTMRLLESFIRWLERRYERKLEKFYLTHRRDFATLARPHLRDRGGSRDPYARAEQCLLWIATGRVNNIAMHRVRVAMPFNPHSFDQKEIHHER